ncbi:hypothetical protein [Vibrio algivorus]|uniref:Uncharacterized protein n=1 Tax=Vibrio algivorus TaxID=1667024 RepID=A0ABQ6ELN4_9VIBR|nr:hypothetical protein [Vibrio algivorus]GLT14043.1 hypothetical protein GCM10007931_10170 [Vibrio algivorus]
MKWILLFFVFVFSNIYTIPVKAETVDKVILKARCTFYKSEPVYFDTYLSSKPHSLCLPYLSSLDTELCLDNPQVVSNGIWCKATSANVRIAAYDGSFSPFSGCPATHPVETSDGRCQIEPTFCSDSSIQKQFQNEQYSCQLNNPNSSFYETVFNWSCVDNESNNSPDVSTSCNYDKKDCIQGLTCESETNPETPICNPENEECALPPETPPEEIPEESTNPDDLNSNPNPCELGIDLCNNSDTPFTDDPNQNPDSSSLSDNPNLTEGDNALYKEAVITNQHLENMNHKMKEFITNYDSKSDQNNKLYKAQLGQQTEINKKLGQQLSGTTQTNKHLDNIENEMNKSFCDKNPEYPDCNKTPFGDLPDFTQSNHFSTVFDSSKFAELSQKKDDLTQQIQDKINQFKTDLNIAPSFSGGSYSDENITLSGRWGTVSTSNSYWSDNSSLISTAIIALCSLVAFSIIIVRRR